MTTYEKMCLSEPMRGILAGLWKPKTGDWYITRKLGLVNQVGYALSITPNQKKNITWLPRADQLMELLGDTFYMITHRDKESFPTTPHPWSVIMDGYFEVGTFDDLKMALLIAFAWTQGLRWKGEKWERRDRG